MLRYHRAIDYGDFSDNAYVVQRVRRYVDYKYWAEIENLDGKHDVLDSSFQQFKAATQAALRELQATFEIWKNERDGISKEQYRKLLELMLELEKKFDSKHLTVLESIRTDFA